MGSLGFSVNTSLTAAMLGLVGFQLLTIGVFARQYASAVGLQPPSPLVQQAEERLSLEVGIILGLGALVMGGGLFVSAFLEWRSTGFGPMSAELTVSRVIPAVTLGMVGVQTIFGSFLLCMIGLMPKNSPLRK